MNRRSFLQVLGAMTAGYTLRAVPIVGLPMSQLVVEPRIHAAAAPVSLLTPEQVDFYKGAMVGQLQTLGWMFRGWNVGKRELLVGDVVQFDGPLWAGQPIGWVFPDGEDGGLIQVKPAEPGGTIAGVVVDTARAAGDRPRIATIGMHLARVADLS